MANCPNCGSENVNFRRESTGETSQSQYQRGTLFSTGKRVTRRAVGHRTVGLCKDCGYTWTVQEDNPTNANSSPQNKGCLFWTFAILFFPIYLSIWFYKSDDVKIEKKQKAIILAVIWAILIIASLISNALNPASPAESAINVPASQSVSTSISESVSEPINVPEYSIVSKNEYARDGKKCMAYRVVASESLTEEQYISIAKDVKNDGYYLHTIWLYSSSDLATGGDSYDIGVVEEASEGQWIFTPAK